MKINNNTSPVGGQLNSNQSVQHAPRNVENYGKSNHNRSNQQVNKDKIRIPENYEAKRVNLAAHITKSEQAFFENMYPNQVNKIRAYMDNSTVSTAPKGQFVDIRR